MNERFSNSRFRPVTVNSIVLVYAFRYALGRMTYAVGDVVDTLVTNSDALPEDTKRNIVRDIRQAIDEDRAGMDFDAEKWMEVVRRFEREFISNESS